MALNVFDEFKVSGVTASTPSNIMLGAGTMYKDFVYSESTHKWSGTILGATSGGTKLTIEPEILDIEVDGVLVKAKGLTHKVGETARIETNLIELSANYFKDTIIGKVGTSADTRFDLIESNNRITDDNYIENLAYVGFKTDGTPIIVLFDYAMCTTGLELEGKNKESAVVPATFDCYAPLEDGQTDTLPYHIYVGKKGTA